MAKQRDYKKEDRHRSSCVFTVRLDNFLMEQLTTRAEMENRTRGSIVVEALEYYLCKKIRLKNLLFLYVVYRKKYNNLKLSIKKQNGFLWASQKPTSMSYGSKLN